LNYRAKDIGQFYDLQIYGFTFFAQNLAAKIVEIIDAAKFFGIYCAAERRRR